MGKNMSEKVNKNTKILCVLILFSINYAASVNCGALIDAITKGIDIPQPKTPEIAFGEVGKAEQQIKELKNELTKLKEEVDQTSDEIGAKKTSVRTALYRLKDKGKVVLLERDTWGLALQTLPPEQFR